MKTLEIIESLRSPLSPRKHLGMRALQYRPFYTAELPVSHNKSACFATRNSHFRKTVRTSRFLERLQTDKTHSNSDIEKRF